LAKHVLVSGENRRIAENSQVGTALNHSPAKTKNARVQICLSSILR